MSTQRNVQIFFKSQNKMNQKFQSGDQRSFHKTISKDDIAQFDNGTVHEVYSTFAIARDAEWSGRLFVLEMKEEGEEGIGTFIHVNHLAPAFPGQEIRFDATFEEITEKGEIITSFRVFQGERLIAEGRQGQRILLRTKIDLIFEKLRNNS
jgi:predicted thioesterase